MRHMLAVTGAVAVILLGTGCSSPASHRPAPPTVLLRLGFLASITQAPALIGAYEGIFARSLGVDVKLRLVPFRAVAQETAALLAGRLDAAYTTADTTLEAWQASHGKLIKVIAGAASGGAELIVRADITTPTMLTRRTLAVPSRGGAQDVALRFWLTTHHLTAEVTPMTQDSAIREFSSGRIAGGWEPAPYDIEMALAGGRVLVNEASLWPNGQFATTSLVVTQKFLATQPAAVAGLLRGQIQANDYIHQHRSRAEIAVNTELTTLTGTSLPADVLTGSFAQITFTDNPVASSLTVDAVHATELGLLKPTSDLAAMCDIGPLNLLLRSAGEPLVSG
jgi:NitT/TauT family transport system substrate-binding protein